MELGGRHEAGAAVALPGRHARIGEPPAWCSTDDPTAPSGPPDTIAIPLFPAGALWVGADQPDFEVAVHLLEPDAPDSLLAWGYLSSVFEHKEWIERPELEVLVRDMPRDPKVAAHAVLGRNRWHDARVPRDEPIARAVKRSKAIDDARWITALIARRLECLPAIRPSNAAGTGRLPLAVVESHSIDAWPGRLGRCVQRRGRAHQRRGSLGVTSSCRRTRHDRSAAVPSF